MSESKHTPGEWYEEDRGERIVILAAGYDREILSVDIPEGEPEEETQRANATIARAAPQMLEALRALVEAHSKIVEGPDLEDEDCHRARAAIAAATGGEQ